MKNAITFAIVSALAVVHGQENPGPSPTNSYGCEPHGDHWFVTVSNMFSIHNIIL